MIESYLLVRTIGRRDGVHRAPNWLKEKHPLNYRLHYGFLFKDKNMKLYINSGKNYESRHENNYFESFTNKVGIYKTFKINPYFRKRYKYYKIEVLGKRLEKRIKSRSNLGCKDMSSGFIVKNKPLLNLDQFVENDYRSLYGLFCFNNGEDLVNISRKDSNLMINLAERFFKKKNSKVLARLKKHLVMMNLMRYALKNNDKRLLCWITDLYPDIALVCMNRIIISSETVTKLKILNKTNIFKSFYLRAFKNYSKHNCLNKKIYNTLRVSFLKLMKKNDEYGKPYISNIDQRLVENKIDSFVLKIRCEFNHLSKELIENNKHNLSIKGENR
jgi:hypothetical protein